MKLRRVMAGTLAATLVLGSSMMVFAADPQTGNATGTGTSVGHVDKEVLTVTLPTNTDSVFNYWVDPERVIDLAGSLADGTAVTKNDDGVYFKQSDNTYASSSNAVEFEGKNSVAVDVSVAAEVTAGAAGKDITLVADDDALTAATTPALLMKLTVGTDTKTITSEGATAKAKLDGVPDNFEVKVNNSAYEYAAKSGATGWAKTTVKLSGKTNKVDIPADMTAPAIKLTWTIEKHDDGVEASGSVSDGVIWMSVDGSNGFSARPSSVTVDGTAVTNYSYESSGWISMTAPTSGAVIRIVVGDTTYKVIAP